MHFVLRTISKNFSIYFEMRGATCSFAKSELGNNGDGQGIFLGNLGLVPGHSRVEFILFFLQVVAFWRK